MQTNWSGAIPFNAAQYVSPESLNELPTLIKQAAARNQCIRPRGSGHSFTPLCQTSDILLDLDLLQGIVSVDQEQCRATAWAGTKLWRFGQEIHQAGLALPNQGDVDRQSLAGALSTGTHGTGIGLKNLSNQVYALDFFDALGDAHHFNADEHPDLIKALSISLGSAGVLTKMTLNLVPSYVLNVEVWREEISTLLKDLNKHLAENRHFEMMYMPLGGWAQAKRSNISNEPPQEKNWWTRFNEGFVENAVFEKINQFAMATDQYERISKWLKFFVGSRQHIDWSHRAFVTDRRVRFNEMEFSVEREKLEEVLDELCYVIKKERHFSLFPIEIRFTKGDDLWLSPSYGRDSAYLAIHVYHREDFVPFFNAMQTIFMRHNGRPHWGKWHSLTHTYFEKVYPKWHEFLATRNRFDPHGLMLNSHLRSIFNP